MKSLADINKEYEAVLHADLDQKQKNKKLSELMTYLELHYKVPILSDPEWERQNKAVIALYRKIAHSRNL